MSASRDTAPPTPFDHDWLDRQARSQDTAVTRGELIDALIALRTKEAYAHAEFLRREWGLSF